MLIARRILAASAATSMAVHLRGRPSLSEPTARMASISDSWSEVFVSADKASCTGNAQEALVQGFSIILLHDVADAAEIDALHSAASGWARCRRAEMGESAHRHDRDHIDAHPESLKTPIASVLDMDGVTRCDVLLVRTLARVQQIAPSLLQTLFGTNCLSDETVVRNRKLNFTPNEPAISVYTAGGYFRPHIDGEKLTVLVPLSSGHAFSGGGTAFWSIAAAREIERTGADLPPTLVVKPPAGTAMLWAGDVVHAGQSVSSGERIVLVASFSPAVQTVGERLRSLRRWIKHVGLCSKSNGTPWGGRPAWEVGSERGAPSQGAAP